jgi:hypothetical protein
LIFRRSPGVNPVRRLTIGAAAPLAPAVRGPTCLDTNKDGYLSKAELEAGHEMLMTKPAPKGH